MNETGNDPRWLAAGLKVATAIIAFRLVSAALEIVRLQIGKIPCQFVASLDSCSSIVMPAIAVAFAVLVSGLPEEKLKGARRKTKIGILVVLFVLAFLPLQLRIRTTPAQCPPEEVMKTR